MAFRLYVRRPKGRKAQKPTADAPALPLSDPRLRKAALSGFPGSSSDADSDIPSALGNVTPSRRGSD